jgi:hypothetical protein
MTRFNRTHAALFDELTRQGIRNADVGRLTRAVLSATDMIAAFDGDRLRQPPGRCASGPCDD